MSVALRVGWTALCGRNAGPLLCTQFALPGALDQRCNITGRLMRGGPLEHAKPYPYKEKSFGIWQGIFDKTSHRFHENSKLICVEGPIGVGKTKFAQELATELDMLYVPHVSMDLVYVNHYGYDMRQLDPQLPPMCRSFDIPDFLSNPNDKRTATMQIMLYKLRYTQYIDALYHMLSTGQGVVMDRCCYSDFVFADAMVNSGFISEGAHRMYYELRNNTIGELMKPHLVIYLDCTVDTVKKRIKARNIPQEVASKVISDKYLTDIETTYKQTFLKDIQSHAEILIYDWTAEGETEVIVEDIERINFAQFEIDPHNKKMKDWRFPLEDNWFLARVKYGRSKQDLLRLFNVPCFDVPELIWDGETVGEFNKVWHNAPGMRYAIGYNEDMGDKNLLLKLKTSLKIDI